MTTNELLGSVLVVLFLLFTVRLLEATDVVRVRALRACTPRPGGRGDRFKLRRVLGEGVGMDEVQGPLGLFVADAGVLGVAGLTL